MLIGVASKSRITRSGAAPASHARSRASARASRIRSSSLSPTFSSTRLAVDTDATFPNSAPCPARTARSETQLPPSAAITARSHRTRPGSLAERRSRVPARAPDRPSVSPSRCAVSASSTVPARDDRPLPSATTSTVLKDALLVTFKMNLLDGWIAWFATATLPAQADDSALPRHDSPPRTVDRGTCAQRLLGLYHGALTRKRRTG